jgi:hypothetical protein
VETLRTALNFSDEIGASAVYVRLRRIVKNGSPNSRSKSVNRLLNWRRNTTAWRW